MSKEPKEFEISRLLELTQNDKYATTVAAFEVIDMLDQIEVPKKYTTRKPSIKAMATLHENVVQWDYVDDEARKALEDELRVQRRGSSALDDVFSAPGSAAPVADDVDEDLEEMVETEPTEQFVDESELEDRGFGEDRSSDEDEEEEEEEEEEASDEDEEEEEEPEEEAIGDDWEEESGGDEEDL